MAQNGAVIVFCSSCKILYFASSVHPKIAAADHSVVQQTSEAISKKHSKSVLSLA